jgi:ribosomal protein L37E
MIPISRRRFIPPRRDPDGARFLLLAARGSHFISAIIPTRTNSGAAARRVSREEPALSVDEAEQAEQTYVCERCGGEYTQAGRDACPACGWLRAPVPCAEDASRQARAVCVICGKPVCGGERDDNAATLCDEHRTISVIEGFSQVYSSGNELEAQLIVENLRAEGIEAATLFSQADHSFPTDIGELAIARILVPAWEHERAQALINDYMDSEGEVVFACPSCGEVYEPGQETCSSCGAPLVG